ncbi:hypothetical protein KC19_VG024600 [Ceratodon purpureus]|uniref:Uncharacterized protein n=1 Tax=Ceratodon purpureus TaxID=3225 RepID=A0A8T0HL91_CERPU|nr:hypothetical protein KC19_VG024600 [Ceratodon purpureus]
MDSLVILPNMYICGVSNDVCIVDRIRLGVNESIFVLHVHMDPWHRVVSFVVHIIGSSQIPAMWWIHHGPSDEEFEPTVVHFPEKGPPQFLFVPITTGYEEIFFFIPIRVPLGSLQCI